MLITKGVEYIHKNITGTDEQTLVERNIKKDIDIRGFTICNNHATDSTYVDLYLKCVFMFFLLGFGQKMFPK